MAEEGGEERTEDPTQRRREEARNEGRIASSQELSSGALLLVAVLLLTNAAPRVGPAMLNYLHVSLATGLSPELTAMQVQNLTAAGALRVMDWFGGLFGMIFIATVVVGLFQSGFQFTPELLTVKLERLDPAQGAQKLFSLAAIVRTGLSFLRVIVIAALIWWVLRGRAVQIAHLGESTVAFAAAEGWEIISRLARAVAAAMFLIGVIDYAYQWYKFEQSLKMTRQELKEELKGEEGDPVIKQRIRRLQREAAQKRMMQEVPKATVVITNPTHLAIAIRYERGAMPAPRVVALGAGAVAQRITALARKHGVPVLERRELAQALYKSVKLDQEVPAALYQVIAELLAFVYRLRGIA